MVLIIILIIYCMGMLGTMMYVGISEIGKCDDFTELDIILWPYVLTKAGIKYVRRYYRK